MNRPDLRMVDEIADQEQRGRGEGRQHHAPVLLDPPRANQEVGDDQQDGGDTVERRVDGWEIL